MKKEEILGTIRSLASSQGWYSRLYNAITTSGDKGEKYLNYLEQQNLKDPVDLIMFIES